MVEVGIMNYEAYRRNFFVELQPKSRFKFRDSFGVTLYFEAFDAAVKYYSKSLDHLDMSRDGDQGLGDWKRVVDVAAGEGGEPYKRGNQFRDGNAIGS